MTEKNRQILIDKSDLEYILEKVKEIGGDTPFYIRHLENDTGAEDEASFEIEIPYKVKGIFGFFIFRV